MGNKIKKSKRNMYLRYFKRKKLMIRLGTMQKKKKTSRTTIL